MSEFIVRVDIHDVDMNFNLKRRLAATLQGFRQIKNPQVQFIDRKKGVFLVKGEGITETHIRNGMAQLEDRYTKNLQLEQMGKKKNSHVAENNGAADDSDKTKLYHDLVRMEQLVLHQSNDVAELEHNLSETRDHVSLLETELAEVRSKSIPNEKTLSLNTLEDLAAHYLFKTELQVMDSLTNKYDSAILNLLRVEGVENTSLPSSLLDVARMVRVAKTPFETSPEYKRLAQKVEHARKYLVEVANLRAQFGELAKVDTTDAQKLVKQYDGSYDQFIRGKELARAFTSMFGENNRLQYAIVGSEKGATIILPYRLQKDQPNHELVRAVGNVVTKALGFDEESLLPGTYDLATLLVEDPSKITREKILRINQESDLAAIGIHLNPIQIRY